VKRSLAVAALLAVAGLGGDVQNGNFHSFGINVAGGLNHADYTAGDFIDEARDGRPRIRVTATCEADGVAVPCEPHTQNFSVCPRGYLEMPVRNLRYSCDPAKKVAKGEKLIALIKHTPSSTVSEKNKCTVTQKVKLATKAGYKAAIIVGARRLPEWERDHSFKPEIPITFVDAEDGKRFEVDRKGFPVHARIWVRAVKVEHGLQITDGGKLYHQGLAMYKQQRYKEAVARLFFATLLEPDFYPAKYNMANALYARQAMFHKIGRDAGGHNLLAPALRAVDSHVTFEIETLLNKTIGTRARKLTGERLWGDRCLVLGKDGKKRKAAKPGRIHLVTVATKENEQLATFRTTAANAGYTLNVLGMGKDFIGHGMKITLIDEFLARKELPENDIIMYVDSNDGLVLAPAKAQLVVREYLKFCSPIVFGAELKLNPDPAVAMFLPTDVPEGVTFRYLNAGQFMGRVGALKKMYKKILADLEVHFTNIGREFPVARCDDQRWIQRYLVYNPDAIALDTQARIFQTLDGLNVTQFEAVAGKGPGFLQNTVSGHRPAVLHVQGPYWRPMYKAMKEKLADWNQPLDMM
jgi:hypothetical protein